MAKKKDFDEKVAAKAFCLDVDRHYLKVDVTNDKIKHFMDQSISLTLFDVVIAGLPFSGKSTLVRNIFKTYSPRSAPGLALYEVILHRDRWTGRSHWVEASKLHAEVHTMFLAFAHYFARQKMPELPKPDPWCSKFEIFSDHKTQKRFNKTYDCLKKLLYHLNSGKQLEKVLSSLLGLSNVYDIGVSKAAYEFLWVVGGGSKMVFVNVLDIFKFDEKSILQPLNLLDASYNGRYDDSQASIFINQNPLHHLIINLVEAAACYETTNTVFVGTHADLLVDRDKRAKDLMLQINECGARHCVDSSTYLDKMITVDATNPEECKLVNEGLIHLLDLNDSFEVTVPMRFIFLRYVLSCTKKTFMKRADLKKYARGCGIDKDEVVEDFLRLFQDCGSIVYYNDKDAFLNSHIILLPIEFLRQLEKLYRVQSQSNSKLTPELTSGAKFGIVCSEVVRTLWLESEVDFNISALESLGLLTTLNNTRDGKPLYFIPSMRLEHNNSFATSEKDLLIIESNVSLIPFSSKQCCYVKYLLNKYKDMSLDKTCPYYNCLSFLWKSRDHAKAKVEIRFFHRHIEVFVSEVPDQLVTDLYGSLKTDFIAIMNTIVKEKPKLNFELCVVCSNQHSEQYFIPFTPGDKNKESLECKQCQTMINLTDLAGSHWVKAPYRCHERTALCSGDNIDPKALVKISDDLSKSLKEEDVRVLFRKLHPTKKEMSKYSFSNVSETLFNVLYKWHCKNPAATKRKLARLVQECGYFKEALLLDPQLLVTYVEKPTDFTCQEITSIAESWTQGADELAEILSISGESTKYKILEKWLKEQEGDKRMKLAEKFEHTYPAMFSAIQSPLSLTL